MILKLSEKLKWKYMVKIVNEIFLILGNVLLFLGENSFSKFLLLIISFLL